MFGVRWLVSGGALVVAMIALYVLLRGGPDRDPDLMIELRAPALDEIDDDSRSAMRELLRRADKD